MYMGKMLEGHCTLHPHRTTARAAHFVPHVQQHEGPVTARALLATLTTAIGNIATARTLFHHLGLFAPEFASIDTRLHGTAPSLRVRLEENAPTAAYSEDANETGMLILPRGRAPISYLEGLMYTASLLIPAPADTEPPALIEVGHPSDFAYRLHSYASWRTMMGLTLHWQLLARLWADDPAMLTRAPHAAQLFPPTLFEAYHALRSGGLQALFTATTESIALSYDETASIAELSERYADFFLERPPSADMLFAATPEITYARVPLVGTTEFDRATAAHQIFSDRGLDRTPRPHETPLDPRFRVAILQLAHERVQSISSITSMVQLIAQAAPHTHTEILRAPPTVWGNSCPVILTEDPDITTPEWKSPSTALLAHRRGAEYATVIPCGLPLLDALRATYEFAARARAPIHLAAEHPALHIARTMDRDSVEERLLNRLLVQRAYGLSGYFALCRELDLRGLALPRTDEDETYSLLLERGGIWELAWALPRHLTRDDLQAMRHIASTAAAVFFQRAIRRARRTTP